MKGIQVQFAWNLSTTELFDWVIISAWRRVKLIGRSRKYPLQRL